MKEIYKITNLINGKFYIGQQLTGAKNYLGSGMLIKKAVKKYGKDNFVKEILCECNNEDVTNALEQFMIIYFNAREIGYNIAKGGNHCSEDGYKRVSITMTGRKRKPFSEEHKSNISKAKIGKASNWKGQHPSEETKNKIAVSVRHTMLDPLIRSKCAIGGHKGLGKKKPPFTEEHIKNLTIARNNRKNKQGN